MTGIHREVARLLEESLHSDPALDFAEAVVRNVTASLAEGDEARLGRQRIATEMVLRLLIDNADPARLGEDLLADPPLLAALFQNVDLLFLRGDARAERVSAAVMRAIELGTGEG